MATAYVGLEEHAAARAATAHTLKPLKTFLGVAAFLSSAVWLGGQRGWSNNTSVLTRPTAFSASPDAQPGGPHATDNSFTPKEGVQAVVARKAPPGPLQSLGAGGAGGGGAGGGAGGRLCVFVTAADIASELRGGELTSDVAARLYGMHVKRVGGEVKLTEKTGDYADGRLLCWHGPSAQHKLRFCDALHGFDAFTPEKHDVKRAVGQAVAAQGQRTNAYFYHHTTSVDSKFWAKVLASCRNVSDYVGSRIMAQLHNIDKQDKADGTVLTQWDLWADKQLSAMIARDFPQHGVLSEEAGHVYNNEEFVWVVDPIDGTANFASGIPIWAISLGLLYSGTPVFGYLHFPGWGYSFHGFYGTRAGLLKDLPTGAFLNGKPISTSTDKVGRNQCFSFGGGVGFLLEEKLKIPLGKARIFGATSINLITVAAGWCLAGAEANSKVWDIAAVWPILHAAGGHWHALEPGEIFPLVPGTDYGRRGFPTLVTARKDISDIFLPLMHPIYKKETVVTPVIIKACLRMTLCATVNGSPEFAVSSNLESQVSISLTEIHSLSVRNPLQLLNRSLFIPIINYASVPEIGNEITPPVNRLLVFSPDSEKFFEACGPTRRKRLLLATVDDGQSCLMCPAVRRRSSAHSGPPL
eukprot:g11117.t1